MKEFNVFFEISLSTSCIQLNIFSDTIPIPISVLYIYNTKNILFNIVVRECNVCKAIQCCHWKGSRQASSHIPRDLQIINPQNTANFWSFSITNLFSKVTAGRFTSTSSSKHCKKKIYFVWYLFCRSILRNLVLKMKINIDIESVLLFDIKSVCITVPDGSCPFSRQLSLRPHLFFRSLKYINKNKCTDDYHIQNSH